MTDCEHYKHAVSLQAKREQVEAIVSRLALQSCRDTRIGSVLSRGISGGEVLPSFIARSPSATQMPALLRRSHAGTTTFDA